MTLPGGWLPYEEYDMQENNPSYKIALADDHVLLRSALAAMINSFGEYRVVLEASNGRELTEKLSRGYILPDVILLDLNMPEMDGFETACWLRDKYPAIRVLMLTMYDSESVLIRLLQAGVRGFLKKDNHPSELGLAIRSVIQSGYYYSHPTSGKLANLLRNTGSNKSPLEKMMLNEQEIAFLKLTSSELTYKEIALQLNLSPRTVDTLRDHLFEKLEVKSRVGLAMYAIRHALVGFNT